MRCQEMNAVSMLVAVTVAMILEHITFILFIEEYLLNAWTSGKVKSGKINLCIYYYIQVMNGAVWKTIKTTIQGNVCLMSITYRNICLESTRIFTKQSTEFRRRVIFRILVTANWRSFFSLIQIPVQSLIY